MPRTDTPGTGPKASGSRLHVQVGAQNAGKSSLVNAMRRAVGHRKPREELTTAAMPGTTLGAQTLCHNAACQCRCAVHRRASIDSS